MTIKVDIDNNGLPVDLQVASIFRLPKEKIAMYAYKAEISLSEDHEIHLSLPKEAPSGKADVLVLVHDDWSQKQGQASTKSWIDDLLAVAPAAPDIPAEALRRESLYADDGR